MITRILLADDHNLMREGLHSLLAEQEKVEVVGEAATGREAVDLARRRRPHVVIMDISMPDMNGIEATRQIVQELPGIKVIVLSMHAEHRFVAEMLSAGASGYLLKDCIADELVGAIQAVMKNQTYLSPMIAGKVAETFVLHHGGYSQSAFLQLSAREREVLQLLAEGHSVKEIAERLGLSPNTIHTHRQHIMKKLQLHSTAELTKYAIREGLTEL